MDRTDLTANRLPIPILAAIPGAATDARILQGRPTHKVVIIVALS
jgi:hypothetical protein